MKNWFRNLTKTLVAAYVFFGLSVLILAAVAYFLINIDVLKNWTIQLPGQKIHVGDTIVVQSVYEKTMNAEGNATRYLECKNRDDIYLRYPLSEAVANRSAGKKGTGIELVMPETIPDVPATCRIAIVIRYEVLPFRHVIEAQESKEFTLYPPEKPAANTGDSDELAQTNRITTQSQGQNLIVSSPQTSSSQSTPTPRTAQRDISQGDKVTDPERPLTPDPQPICEPVIQLPLVGTLYCRYS